VWAHRPGRARPQAPGFARRGGVAFDAPCARPGLSGHTLQASSKTDTTADGQGPGGAGQQVLLPARPAAEPLQGLRRGRIL